VVHILYFMLKGPTDQMFSVLENLGTNWSGHNSITQQSKGGCHRNDTAP